VVYTATVTTVANTSDSSPLVTNIKVTRGVLYRFEVYFPPGPSGLVGVQVRVADHQLYPVQREEWFIGDNVTIAFDDIYEMANENSLLTLRTYNTDTLYDHIVQVRFGLMMLDEFYARYGLALGVERLESTLKNIEDQTKKASTMTVEEALKVI